MHCRTEYMSNHVTVCVEREKQIAYKRILGYNKNKHNRGHRDGMEGLDGERRRLNEDFEEEEMIHQLTCRRIQCQLIHEKGLLDIGMKM